MQGCLGKDNKSPTVKAEVWSRKAPLSKGKNLCFFFFFPSDYSEGFYVIVHLCIQRITEHLFTQCTTLEPGSSLAWKPDNFPNRKGWSAVLWQLINCHLSLWSDIPYLWQYRLKRSELVPWDADCSFSSFFTEKDFNSIINRSKWIVLWVNYYGRAIPLNCLKHELSKSGPVFFWTMAELAFLKQKRAVAWFWL